MNFKYIGNLLFLLFLLTGCRKVINIDEPVTSYSSEDVYSKDATATSVLTGLYTTLGNVNFTGGGVFATGSNGVAMRTGLLSDELSLYGGALNNSLIVYYQNNLNGNIPDMGSEYWDQLYYYIFICNSAIEGLQTSGSLSPYVKDQLSGEVRFMRAFFYFYLVNLFGDVPLVVSTDYEQNSHLTRADRAKIYGQIIIDLTEAKRVFKL